MVSSFRVIITSASQNVHFLVRITSCTEVNKFDKKINGSTAEEGFSKYALKLSRQLTAFQDEQNVLSTMTPHPNIISYYGSWSNGDLHCIETQYIEGRSLLEILMDGPLSETQAHSYFKQLVQGMAHAHEQCGIIHRDLKTENIMISASVVHHRLGHGIKMVGSHLPHSDVWLPSLRCARALSDTSIPWT